MYINTSHRVGDTVYVYDDSTDTVMRGTVLRIDASCTALGYSSDWNLSFLVKTKSGYGAQQFQSRNEDELYTRPEAAFYDNPLEVAPTPLPDLAPLVPVAEVVEG